MNMPINTHVWAAHGETFSAATKTNLDRIILENMEKEKTATILHEGDSCLTSDGKVKIKVMTDGSWQKRYGRNFFTASAPTSVSSHMRMAQLHKQDGQGAVTLKVLKTRGMEASSPETEKKLVEMDKMRKKKRRWHIFLFIRPKIKCYSGATRKLRQ